MTELSSQQNPPGQLEQQELNRLTPLVTIGITSRKTARDGSGKFWRTPGPGGKNRETRSNVSVLTLPFKTPQACPKRRAALHRLITVLLAPQTDQPQTAFTVFESNPSLMAAFVKHRRSVSCFRIFQSSNVCGRAEKYDQPDHIPNGWNLRDIPSSSINRLVLVRSIRDKTADTLKWASLQPTWRIFKLTLLQIGVVLCKVCKISNSKYLRPRINGLNKSLKNMKHR